METFRKYRFLLDYLYSLWAIPCGFLMIKYPQTIPLNVIKIFGCLVLLSGVSYFLKSIVESEGK